MTAKTNYEGKIPPALFKKLVLISPMPCVDIILVRKGHRLIGKRQIIPLKNKWALIGGRIYKNEYPQETCERQLKLLGLKGKYKSMVGTFATKWNNHPQKRYDITLCYLYDYISGEPDDPTGELFYFSWEKPEELRKFMPKHYMKMIEAAKP